ncbi:hypothetical protein UY3_06406 [Chelonia mydas]|uniref:Uncharacterized protein n=1 Tax=Chelonia mydas TaxID=8469 RepID=M7BGU0_CHEMY|nr:hypothetical protein UY3_06406 [Chelonia mydas]
MRWQHKKIWPWLQQKKSHLPPMTDSQFTEKDLNNIFTFEFEKPKFGLLGKAKKKLATCKVEKEVNGELKPCSFKTSEASAMKSFNLWRHVKRNYPENYVALVTKKDQEDEAKQKVDTAKRRSSGFLKTPEEKIFYRASSEKKPKIEQTKLDSYLKSSKRGNEAMSTSENRDVDRTEAILPEEGTKGMDEIELNMDAALQWINDPSLILPTWLHEDDSKVQLMGCGIHTLQLAVWDGLNKEHAKKFLAKIRQVIVKLRTPSTQSVLLDLHGITQSLDTMTRWGSTFAMID